MLYRVNKMNEDSASFPLGETSEKEKSLNSVYV